MNPVLVIHKGRIERKVLAYLVNLWILQDLSDLQHYGGFLVWCPVVFNAFDEWDAYSYVRINSKGYMAELLPSYLDVISYRLHTLVTCIKEAHSI